MTWKFWKNEEEPDPVMDKVLEELRIHDPNSEEFARNLSYLERLTELKTDTRRKMRSIDPNTVLTVAGTLAGVVFIAAYEQKHAWTSKAPTFKIPNTPQ